jgi:secreted PhoX family phosphatase
MVLSRRDLLVFLGATLGTVACGRLQFPNRPAVSLNLQEILGFQPIKGPIPLATDALTPDQQIAQYSVYNVVDDLVLPEGFTYDIIAAWGDPVGDSRFGYNNDYLAFFPTGQDTARLVVNFEYISAIPWQQTYQQVIGKSLPLDEVKTAIQTALQAGNNQDKIGLNAYALPADDPLKAKVITICREALIDQGVGILSLKRNANGQWQYVPAPGDRRITGISGLEDGRYLKATGPAVAIFQKSQGQGYIDSLGDKIIGTMQNCAGGQTPWGTVLSAEENFQGQVPEAVYPDGTSFWPETRPFSINDEELMGLGNVFGLAGNKYGWIVEIDPANPDDYGTKHTWLGRYRHEAVGIRVEAGKPLAFYSGCDRRGGHL